MKTEDLTQVKHVGASRMKSLKDIGINTLKQLYETPIEKLEGIPTIGKHYAKLIKDAVSEYYKQKPEKITLETVPGGEEKTEELKENLIKKIKIFKKRLKRINKNLKPPEKKKHLKSYDEFRKRSKTLINRIDGLVQMHGGLPKKVSKKINKRVDALNSELKNVRKKINKRNFQELSREIQLFLKMLKKNIN